MRTGLIVSVIGHLAILLWGLISLSSSRAFDPVVEVLPVDFVEVDEVTKSPKGMTTASLSDKPSPNDPSEKAEVEKPQPMPPKPQAKPAPPPPPPPPPPAKAAPPEPPKEAATKPPPPPEPAMEKLDEPKPEATPEPTPETEAAAAESPPKPVPVPKVRPKHQPPTPPTPAEPTEEFDPDRIAALLDKEVPSGAPEESAAPASLGVPFDSANLEMTQNEIDRLRSQIQACWVVPVGWTDPKQVTVTIRFGLNQDGSVFGVPEVIEFPASQYGQVSADNAIRAVLQCGPYQLPPEKYDQWREVQLRFTPQS